MTFIQIKYFLTVFFTNPILEPRFNENGAGLFKEGLNKPRVSGKFDFRYESLRSKFSFILSANNSTPENTFEQKKKKPGLKFKPGLALIGLRTTGP